MTDPIADLLTHIRNAARVRHKKVDIPASNLKKRITQILYEEKYIHGYSVLDDIPQGTIRIYLKYYENKSVITGIKRISTPGLRYYEPSKNLPRTLNGLGITILSTSKGVMTDHQARKENVGGEILCSVW